MSEPTFRRAIELLGRAVQILAELETVDELRFYSKAEVARRTLRSERSVQEDEKRPDCPLKWLTLRGKRVACDAATLKRYLEWLRTDLAVERAMAGHRDWAEE